MRLSLLLLTVVAAASFAVGCGSRSSAIAELVKSEGPVDRRVGEGSWEAAALATKFYLGDSARTADGGAELQISGGARLRMQPHSVLRFGGDRSASKIKVEMGGVEVIGTGEIGFDIGNLRITNGRVAIGVGTGGQSQIQLIVGQARLTNSEGETVLSAGITFEIDGLRLTQQETVAVADAAVVDAAIVDAAPAPIPPGTLAQIDVTGRGAELQGPGEKAWKKLSAGKAELPGGSKVRLTGAATAKLTALGTTLALGRNSTASIDDSLWFSLELGTAKASGPTNGEGKLAVPGGGLSMKGTPQSSSEAKVEVTRAATTVTVLLGLVTLTGADGAELAMSQGEKASLARAGAIRVLDQIPKYFDFSVPVGDTITIHDPIGATAVQFAFAGKCSQGGVIEVDKNGTFRTPKVSAGKDDANHMLRTGAWHYRLLCNTGAGSSSGAAGRGTIVVKRDDGRRRLPPIPPTNPIAKSALGKSIRISYQSQIPSLAVTTGGSKSSITVTAPGKAPESPIQGTNGQVLIPGTSLSEGVVTLMIERDGVKDPKPTLIQINYDNTAPQVYIESPINATPWDPAGISIRGSVLQGWSAWVDTNPLKLSDTRRFAANVPKPAGRALAIKLSHPKRGVHYYLRREQ